MEICNGIDIKCLAQLKIFCEFTLTAFFSICLEYYNFGELNSEVHQVQDKSYK